MIEALTNWLDSWRTAWRQLRKHPRFTVVIVVTAAVGIGLNAAIFSVVDVVLLRRPPYPLPAQIVELRGPGQGFVSFGRSIEIFPVALRDLSLFKTTGLYIAGGVNLGGETPRRVAAAAVSPGFFDVLAVPPAVGAVFTERDVSASPRLVVLGWELWRGQFGGDPSAVGRELVLDDATFVVSGVMPAGVTFPAGAQLWVPTGAPTGIAGQIPTPVVMARLQPGLDITSVKQQVIEVAGVGATSAADVSVRRLDEALVGGRRPTALLIWIASGLVLLVSCSNITNLLLAHVWLRRSELSTRYAVGAGPIQLLKQLSTETLLLAGLGALVAVPGVLWLLGAARALLPAEWQGVATVAADGRLVAAMIVLTVGATGLCTLIPAAWLWLWVQRGTADGRTIGGNNRWNRVRTGLVLSEIAIAVLLLAGASTLMRSVSELMRVDIGASGDRAVVMKISLQGSRYRSAQARRQFLERLDSAVGANAGVEAVGVSDQLPGRSTDLMLARSISIAGMEDRGSEGAQTAVVLSASPGFFAASGIELLAGRTFTHQDGASVPTVVVVSEGFGRALGLSPEQVVGHRLGVRAGSTAIPPEIVGVVRDIRIHGPEQPFVAAVYRPVASNPPSSPVHLVVKARSDNPIHLVPAIRQAVGTLDGNMPLYDIAEFQNIRRTATADRQLALAVMLTFGTLALLLCAIGLYGLIAHTAETSRRDVAVRMALGASRASIYRRMVRSAALHTLIGVGAGVVAAMAGGRLFAAQFGRLGTPALVDLTTASLVVFVLSMSAAMLPMYRAANSDPAELLRTANKPGLRS
jgi:putative ABC transport system permease protein